ncbi:sensor histidine kinase [Lysinibacillus xylanilyticus]|uniref:sensor histidine kinase n=1 Tax=Lysinibacillus xylanilyticus TaxID=582475 RepID=UPI003D0297FF
MKIQKNIHMWMPIFITTLLVIYYFFLTIKYPLIGIEVIEKDEQYFVDNIYENSWGINKDIQPGDKVLKVNNLNPFHHNSIVYFQRIELANSLTILNATNETVTFFVENEIIDLTLEVQLLIKILSIIITIALAIVLNTRHSEKSSSKVLTYFLLTIALCYSSASISARGDLIGRSINTITLPIFVILFIHFLYLHFSNSKLQFIKTIYLKALYLLFFIIMIISFISFVNKDLQIPSKNIQLTLFSSLVFLLLFLLIRYYYINREPNVRITLKIMFSSCFIAFSPFILSYAIPIVFHDSYLISAEITGIFIFIIPFTLVYLQLTFELMDIDFYLNKIKYFTLLSIPFSILTILIISFITGVRLLSIESLILGIVIFYLSCILLYIKDYLDYRLNPHLFSKNNRLDISLYSFFQKVKFETNPFKLIDSLQKQIKDVLSVENLKYIKIEKRTAVENWATKTAHKNVNYDEIQKINWAQYSIGSQFKVHKGFATVIGSNEICKEIIYFEQKKNNAKLNPQEKAWLESISYFSSIVLENNYLIEELKCQLDSYKNNIDEVIMPTSYSKLLMHVTEKERVNLSMDLHDSVLQVLLQLRRNIEGLIRNADKTSLRKELDCLKEDITDIAHLVRETCIELRPPFIKEEGLEQALGHLIASTRLQCDFSTYFDYDSRLEGLSYEFKINIYRIVQELLNNARKHSNANEVEISIFYDESQIILLYDDDGVGLLNSSEMDTNKIGMFSIKERVRILNGNIEINSSLNKGLHICITV